MARRLTAATLGKWQQVLKLDRSVLIDVFKPNATTGTLTSYNLPAAFDSMKKKGKPAAAAATAAATDTKTSSLLEHIYDLCQDMPWTTASGTPGLLQTHQFAHAVQDLDNASDAILDMALEALRDPASHEHTIATLAMLKVIYAHLINNFCYEPCRHELEVSGDPNRVGKANAVVPAQLAQPRTILCTLFDTEIPQYRWQNYNEYSPANCRVVPEDASVLDQLTVTTMARGEGSRDEIGFIGNHYVQESRTPLLVEACENLLAASKHADHDGAANAYDQAVTAMQNINSVNKTMPAWCSPRGYNQLRIWIPGPKNHSGTRPRDLFPEQGVCFEGSEDLGAPLHDMSRGETGAMTSIIKLARTMALFSYDTRVFGENELTLAQRDFDARRETGQRQFLDRTAQQLRSCDAQALVHSHARAWFHLTRLRNQIIEHNITHYGYSRNYIFENKEASTSALFEATGGTTHQFLPTSALANISTTLSEIAQLKHAAAATDLTQPERHELAEIEDRLSTLQDVTQKQRDRIASMDASSSSSLESSS